MGIEIPEALGGAGGTLLHGRARRRGAVAGGCVGAPSWWTCRTRWSTTPAALGQRRRRSSATCRGSRREWVGAYALSEAGSGSDAFALATRAEQKRRPLGPDRPQAVDHQRRRGGALHRLRERRSRRPGYKGITAFLVERALPGLRGRARRRTSSASAPRSTCELILDDCEVPAANVLGEVGKGYKVAIETLNEGRIGIGAQMIGLAQGALDAAIAYVQGAQAVRQADRRVPGACSSSSRRRPRSSRPRG